ncbi:MAG: sigma-70 family RNA polymerase sigma factor [Dehalococcoidales bacterium]|nr:MAG: sigma-70 family RNA polymerase sigma factor [Dehalococcoidales bacterium]
MPEEKREKGISSKEDALAGLYNEYYDKIARYIYVRMGNRAEAEDMAGEVFLKALESLGSYKERGVPMQAWLFRIAHNLVVDYLRRSSRRGIILVDDVEVEAETNPQEIAETNIEMARVSEAMTELTPAQKQVIELRFFGGLTSEEAGKVMNKSSGAVREMQSAAIKRLRELLVDES